MSRFSKSRVLGVAVLCAATLTAQRASTAGSSPIYSEHSMRLVVQNHYYAKPGKVDEVYQWRLHASDVRARLGLARGRVLKLVHSADDPIEGTELADVVWECEYASRAAREADIARLDASGEFVPVERHMQDLILKFRRLMFEVDPRHE